MSDNLLFAAGLGVTVCGGQVIHTQRQKAGHFVPLRCCVQADGSRFDLLCPWRRPSLEGVEPFHPSLRYRTPVLGAVAGFGSEIRVYVGVMARESGGRRTTERHVSAVMSVHIKQGLRRRVDEGRAGQASA